MSQRESLEFEGAICERLRLAAWAGGVDAGCGAWQREIALAIHCLRDPTRGGVATTLNEIAKRAGVGMLLRERAIPVRESVQGACEMLGLDPLYVANEG